MENIYTELKVMLFNVNMKIVMQATLTTLQLSIFCISSVLQDRSKHCCMQM